MLHEIQYEQESGFFVFTVTSATTSTSSVGLSSSLSFVSAGPRGLFGKLYNYLGLPGINSIRMTIPARDILNREPIHKLAEVVAIQHLQHYVAPNVLVMLNNNSPKVR